MRRPRPIGNAHDQRTAGNKGRHFYIYIVCYMSSMLTESFLLPLDRRYSSQYETGKLGGVLMSGKEAS